MSLCDLCALPFGTADHEPVSTGKHAASENHMLQIHFSAPPDMYFPSGALNHAAFKALRTLCAVKAHGRARL